MNCDSHNYLLGLPVPDNTDSDIKRSRIENKSQRGAVIFNMSYQPGRDPIQVIARRIAKNAVLADAGHRGSG